MLIYKADNEVYYVRHLGTWYEVVRHEGASEVEPEDGLEPDVYMNFVVDDIEEVEPGDAPAWVMYQLADVLY